MGKGVAMEVPGMSQTKTWVLNVQNCKFMIRRIINKMSLKSNSNLVTIQADALDEFAWSNALRQYTGVVPYCPITMSASKRGSVCYGGRFVRGVYSCTVPCVSGDPKTTAREAF